MINTALKSFLHFSCEGLISDNVPLVIVKHDFPQEIQVSVLYPEWRNRGGQGK